MASQTWTDKQLRQAVKASTSYKETSLNLGLKSSSFVVTQRIKELDIDTSHFAMKTPTRAITWNIEELKECVSTSNSLAEVARKMGWKSLASASKNIRQYNLDTKHFDSKQPTSNKRSTNTTWTDQELIAAVKESDNWGDVRDALGLKNNARSNGSYRKRTKQLGLDVSHFSTERGSVGTRTWTDDELVTAVSKSSNYREVALRLGLAVADRENMPLRKRIKTLDLDTSHFTHYGWKYRTPINAPLEDVLVPFSMYSRSALRRRLFATGIKQPVCEIKECGQGEIWFGQKMIMILDHKNGINNDNRLENLRILCPNCAHTLSTHGGKNKERRNFDREERKRIMNEWFDANGHNALERKRNIEQEKLLNPRIPKFPSQNPGLSIILMKLKYNSFLQVGKTYGVSDNAVRKWIMSAIRDTVMLEVEREGWDAITSKYRLTQEYIERYLSSYSAKTNNWAH